MSKGRKPETSCYSYTDSYKVFSFPHKDRSKYHFKRGLDHFTAWHLAAEHACTEARRLESAAAFRVRDLKILLARAEKELRYAKELLANAHDNSRDGKIDQ